MESSKRATPIARLKRRILQRRRCASPISELSKNQNPKITDVSTKSHNDIQTLESRPATPSKAIPTYPKDKPSKRFSLFKKHNREEKSDGHHTRAVTPQPRQKPTPQSYLDRWKAAQLESRPCTALGLISQTEVGFKETLKNFSTSRHSDFPIVGKKPEVRKIACTRDFSGKNIETPKASYGGNVQPVASLHCQSQREPRSQNISGLSQRPVTSLGTLTQREYSSSSKHPVDFQGKPETASVSTYDHLQYRSATPGPSKTFLEPPPPILNFKERSAQSTFGSNIQRNTGISSEPRIPRPKSANRFVSRTEQSQIASNLERRTEISSEPRVPKPQNNRSVSRIEQSAFVSNVEGKNEISLGQCVPRPQNVNRSVSQTEQSTTDSHLESKNEISSEPRVRRPQSANRYARIIMTPKTEDKTDKVSNNISPSDDKGLPERGHGRRFVIARSRGASTRVLLTDEVIPSHETLVRLSTASPREATNEQPDRSNTYSPRKKVGNSVTKAIKLPRPFTPQPRKYLNHQEDNIVPSPKTAPEYSTRLCKKGASVVMEGRRCYSRLWAEDTRCTDNCVSEESDTSAPQFRRHKPATTIIMAPVANLVESAANEAGSSNKEDRILSWLGGCEEPTLPAHLPFISNNNPA